MLPSPDTFSRTRKIFTDSSEALTFEAAQAMAATFVLQVHVGLVAGNSTLQAAVLTVINAGARAFEGGVLVRIADDCELATGWHKGELLSAAVVAHGGVIVEGLAGDQPTICVGQPGMDVRGRPVLRAVASGWSAGVVDGTEAPFTEVDRFTVTGIAAGGIAVAEAFESRRTSNVYAGHRSHGLSLWRPAEDWLAAKAAGPADVTYAPSAWWLAGLGHLGQGYLWSIGMLRYAQPGDVHLILQDDDVITESNESTGLLLVPGTAVNGDRRRKTRELAGRLEARGFGITITERRLHAGDGPHGDEPRLALIGVDNPATRRALSETRDFALIVDVGLGGGPRHYLDIQLHSFPASRRSDEVPGWQDTPARTATLMGQPAYREAAEQDPLCQPQVRQIELPIH